jgi:hypothetical protein
VDHHAQAIQLAVSMRERRYTQVRGQLRDTWPQGHAGTAVVFHVNDDLFRTALGLTVTQVRHCRDGVELIRLLGVEGVCHGLFEDPSTMLLNGFIHGVGGEIELARPFDEPLIAMDALEQLRIL